jgi:hypothetical protein
MLVAEWRKRVSERCYVDLPRNAYQDVQDRFCGDPRNARTAAMLDDCPEREEGHAETSRFLLE